MERRTSQRSRENDVKLRLALRAAQIGIWDWTVETGAMDYSARARTIFGFKPSEPVTIDMVRAATHPDDLPYTWAQARRALDPAIRDKSPYEYRILRVDTGEERWVVAHGEAIFAESGGAQRAVRYIGTIQDITDRKKVEQALRESEMRQRLAIDAARMAVWELDLATETVTVSPELNRMFGFAPDACPTIEDFRAAYGPGEREKVQLAGQEALARGEMHFEAEFRCRRPDGNLYWLLMRAEVIARADGSFDRVIGVLMDIDAQKRAEERQTLLLRELNHRVKNSLSVVQSLATQTFRSNVDPAAALKAFRERLQALAQANDVLLTRDWTAVSLKALVDQIVSPYRDPADRFLISGEDVALPPRLNVPIALALHEMCTNAAKYGALSVPAGKVSIDWRRIGDTTELIWREHGGPPVASPIQPGFGTRLVTQILAVEIGKAELDPRPEGMRLRLLISGIAG